MYLQDYRGFWSTTVSIKSAENKVTNIAQNMQRYAVTYAAGINDSRDQFGVTR